MNRLLNAYLTFLKPEGKTYLFLDEVQNVHAWERFVREMIDKGGRQIFITGSSSKLLSRELGTLLTGRHLDAAIYPLNFSEFLSFKGLAYGDRLDMIRRQDEIRGKIRVYYSMGVAHIKPDPPLPFSLTIMTYYSVVTFTTLGFGDVKPQTEVATIVVLIEVILGYVMLGGLVSIFANKVARRS